SLITLGKETGYNLNNHRSIDQTNNEDSFKAKLYRFHKSKFYYDYRLIFLNIIDKVTETSPSDRVDLRENNFIIFIGRTKCRKNET
ncbi:unnamed protein product, partial [Rotaria sordida]